ncbi:MAG: cob(I)yrinic acid a,c-diamide adenosyltransferase [Candidatus Bathyarchaeota archaeon]
MGYIYLYTGTGGGKTVNALGLALRSVGHERKVVIIQFLKWWKNTGEYKIREKLQPFYEIYQFGRDGWIGLDNLGEEDRRLSKEGLNFAKKVVEEKKPHLLILDEINLALHCNMLEIKEVMEFLDSIPEGTDVVLTGRYAPKELVDRADFVNEVKDIKHPEEMVTTEGIQY